MKKLTLILLIPFVLFLACSAEEDSVKTIRYACQINAGTLNPHKTSEIQMYAQAMLYESLVNYGENGVIEPCLAESWEISQDGKAITFKLREDVVFSNGEPFNAEAAKANFDTLLANAERHSWLQTMALLEGTDVVSEYEIRVRLSSPYSSVLQELTLIRPIRFLAPSSIPETGHTGEGLGGDPIGTGPWKLESSTLGVEDVFVVNDLYWGEKPKVNRVVVKVIPDPDARALALEAGEIDLVYGKEGQLSPDSFARFGKSERFNAQTSIPFSTRTIAMNTTRSGLDDLAVRQAINHALDKESLTRNIMHGTEAPADTLFSPTTRFANIPLEPYAFDPQKARQLLDDAGWKIDGSKEYRSRDGVELNFDLVYIGSDAVMKAMSEYAQASLKDIGIRLSLEPEERTIFYQKQKKGDFDMIYSVTWGIPYDPHVFMSSMRRPSHADYEAQLGLARKAEIDALITEALLSTDETLQRANYREVLTELHRQAVYLPLSYRCAIAVAGERLEDFEMAKMTNIVPFGSMSLRE